VNEKCYFIVCAGGVLFKVYIVGDAIKVVRRFSLPDVSKWELSKDAGIYNFPRVSCAAASADDADLDPTVAGKLSCLLVQKHSIELYFLKANRSSQFSLLWKGRNQVLSYSFTNIREKPFPGWFSSADNITFMATYFKQNAIS